VGVVSSDWIAHPNFKTLLAHLTLSYLWDRFILIGWASPAVKALLAETKLRLTWEVVSCDWIAHPYFESPIG
jgi:hypothetical protein